MAGKITDIGERKILEGAIVALGVLTVKLIKAYFTPTDTIAVVDLVEANYPGYAPQPLAFAGLLPGNPGGRAVATFAALTFTCDGPAVPNTIYGYWIEDSDGDIVGIERLPGVPRQMIAAGNQLVINPKARLWCPV